MASEFSLKELLSELDATRDLLSGGLPVTAQLNHLLDPLDRGARYEDPLEQALPAHGLGKLDGGGTLMLQSGEIERIDIEVVLTDATRGIPFLIETLEGLGAPRGSKLQVQVGEELREVPFGRTEGVAVYLNGTTLPDDVYATSDVNVVREELNKRLAGQGEMETYWEGPTETALYFYGQSADDMKARMADFLASYPLCSGARVVTIAPRTVSGS